MKYSLSADSDCDKLKTKPCQFVGQAFESAHFLDIMNCNTIRTKKVRGHKLRSRSLQTTEKTYRYIGYLLLALFLERVFALSTYKLFAIDELGFSHIAWLIGKGEVPFRDFVAIHHPLFGFVIAIPFLFANDHPGTIIFLRWTVFLFITLYCCAVLFLEKRNGLHQGLLAVLLTLSTSSFTVRAVEIRPDLFSFGLFISSMAIIGSETWTPSKRGLLGGIALGLALSANQKIYYYGSFFAMAFFIDVLRFRSPGRRHILGDPWYFFFGFTAVLFLGILYLWITESTSQFTEWAYVYVLELQSKTAGFEFFNYPGWKHFQANYIPLMVFGILGWLWNCQRVLRNKNCREVPGEVLLIGCFPFALIFPFLAARPFEYYLIPPVGLLAIFAARLVWKLFSLASSYRHQNVWLSACVGLITGGFIVFHLLTGNYNLTKRQEPTNALQIKVWDRMNELVDKDDCVYDNSATYVTRWHAYYLFQTSDVMRGSMPERLRREIPQAVLRNQCPAMMMDWRFFLLPKETQMFLLDNFQNYNGFVFLWGKWFSPMRMSGVGSFHAIKDGKYFIFSPSSIPEPGITIGGNNVTSEVFELRAGIHRVEFGEVKVNFAILRLPADGKKYQPANTLLKFFPIL